MIKNRTDKIINRTRKAHLSVSTNNNVILLDYKINLNIYKRKHFFMYLFMDNTFTT